MWSSSSELVYRTNGRFIAASLRTQPRFEVLRRDTLFIDRYWTHPGQGVAQYDISADGKLFVVVKPVREPAQPVIALRWLQHIERTH